MRRNGKSWPIEWTLTQLDPRTGRPIGEELPARVPGDVFSDLLAAGKIADPYLGFNSREVQWVNDYDWLYRGTVALEPSDHERLWLEFMGLDYRYAISWNDRELLRGEGMFSRRRFEVAPGSRSSQIIEVRFFGFPDHWIESRFPPIIINTEPVRRRYLKTPMSFGWDFAPRLKGCGIWDEARLFASGPALIKDLCVRTQNRGAVDLELELDSQVEAEAALELAIVGETFPGFQKRVSVPLRLTRNPGLVVRHRLQIESPRLWWPWDQGRPELYRLTAVIMVHGRSSDAVEELFGFRELGWIRNPGSPPRALDWTLVVNGRRVFLRGANLVPFEAMAGRRRDDRCLKLLQMAPAANLNCLRLWGGGNREPSLVYEACDRLGLLVWQEFPIGCINFALPRSARFSALLKQECAEIVRQLRNHPALITWCGGNEFNVRLNRPAIATMKKTCRELDPDRRFIPASPFRGDAHNWLVWHLKGNLSDYAADRSQLVSEFGLQAPPDVASLKDFLPADQLWPISPAWTHRHLSPGKMNKYVKHFAGPSPGLEEYVAAVQEAQAHFLHRGIEQWRRQKYRKSGALIWQWNEPWPCVSWSVVDYYLRPKRAYEKVRLAFQPLLVSAEFAPGKYRPGDRLAARIFLVNDLPRAFPDLEIEVRSGGETMQRLRGSVGADEVVMVAEIALTLPDQDPPRLELLAQSDAGPVSENSYDLSHHDPEPASWLKRRLFRRWWQFLTE